MDAPSFASLPVPEAGEQCVITLDALVSGVHFPPDTPVADVAWKSLAVNLSDLAAMGADALALQVRCESPCADAGWGRAFARCVAQAASTFAVPVHLVLADGRHRRISVQALGRVPAGSALTRSGARPGDQVWISGTLGDAGAGLALEQGRLEAAPGADRDLLLARLARPQPRLALGRALRGIASAAIDVSDGIAGDAGHLARRSSVRITLQAHRLPLSDALSRLVSAAAARGLALRAGDDYELLFCAPPRYGGAVRAAGRAAGIPVTQIGAVSQGTGLIVLDERGRECPLEPAYQHFSGADG